MFLMIKILMQLKTKKIIFQNHHILIKNFRCMKNLLKGHLKRVAISF